MYVIAEPYEGRGTGFGGIAPVGSQTGQTKIVDTQILDLLQIGGRSHDRQQQGPTFRRFAIVLQQNPFGYLLGHMPEISGDLPVRCEPASGGIAQEGFR